jgi:hypothetical protein
MNFEMLQVALDGVHGKFFIRHRPRHMNRRIDFGKRIVISYGYF